MLLRLDEHKTKYRKIKNVTLEIEHYSYIDDQYIQDAMKKYFRTMEVKIKNKEYIELVAWSKEELSSTKKEYVSLGISTWEN